MCLYTKYKKPIVAVDDIVCYKMCQKLKNNVFAAPYIRNYVYKIGQLHTETNFQTVAEPNSIGKLYRASVGFHSFVNKYDAMRFTRDDHDRSIFKCIIPKGSRYFIGKYYNDGDSYCSDNIIIGVDEKPYEPSLMDKISYVFVDMYESFLKI